MICFWDRSTPSWSAQALSAAGSEEPGELQRTVSTSVLQWTSPARKCTIFQPYSSQLCEGNNGLASSRIYHLWRDNTWQIIHRWVGTICRGHRQSSYWLWRPQTQWRRVLNAGITRSEQCSRPMLPSFLRCMATRTCTRSQGKVCTAGCPSDWRDGNTTRSRLQQRGPS